MTKKICINENDLTEQEEHTIEISKAEYEALAKAGYNIVSSPDKNLMKEKKNVSKQIIWKYSSKNNVNFYNTIGGSSQRLPNGNTFICSTNDGHLFEVAPLDTSIVWEYICPVTTNGIKKIKVSTFPHNNALFRALRYTSDHPALAGHDLAGGAGNHQNS